MFEISCVNWVRNLFTIWLANAPHYVFRSMQMCTPDAMGVWVCFMSIRFQEILESLNRNIHTFTSCGTYISVALVRVCLWSLHTLVHIFTPIPTTFGHKVSECMWKWTDWSVQPNITVSCECACGFRHSLDVSSFITITNKFEFSIDMSEMVMRHASLFDNAPKIFSPAFSLC